MMVHFTESAAAYIRERHFPAGEPGWLKLVYDTEGCGCAVNGIAGLWIVEGIGPEDRRAECASFPLVYDARQELFFEEALTVDYRTDSRSLVLKSRQQTYNPSITITDKRGGHL